MRRELLTMVVFLFLVMPVGAQEATVVGPSRGSLVIMGGGGKEMPGIFGKFVELAGGKDARIVVVTTAISSDPKHNYDRSWAAKLARDDATGDGVTDANAATGHRTCKLCDETKPVNEFPPRQLRKARSACSACCESQAAKDAPAPERNRKMTKREKLMEAIEARKKKRAENAKEEDAEKNTDTREETKKPEQQPREEDLSLIHI